MARALTPRSRVASYSRAFRSSSNEAEDYEIAETLGRPLIGIVAATEDGAAPLAVIVRRSGGEPRFLPAGDPTGPAEIVRAVDGLVVAGLAETDAGGDTGADAPGIGDGGVPGREELAAPQVVAALERDVPLLAVGSGMHALNVALGGGLIELRGHSTSLAQGVAKSSYHRVYIAPGSKLAAIVGSGGFVRVNSRHRRGVREAQKAPRLLASAYSLEDGVIEALESPDHGWVVGVQFHPERRLELPPHFDRLFQSLVERAASQARVKGR